MKGSSPPIWLIRGNSDCNSHQSKIMFYQKSHSHILDPKQWFSKCGPLTSSTQWHLRTCPKHLAEVQILGTPLNKLNQKFRGWGRAIDAFTGSRGRERTLKGWLGGGEGSTESTLSKTISFYKREKWGAFLLSLILQSNSADKPQMQEMLPEQYRALPAGQGNIRRWQRSRQMFPFCNSTLGLLLSPTNFKCSAPFSPLANSKQITRFEGNATSNYCNFYNDLSRTFL